MTDKRKPMAAAAAFLALLPLAGCGGNSSGQTKNNVDALENAAEQADPMTRNVLLNQAERIEGTNTQLPPGAPGSPTQQALEQAANANAQANEPPQQAVPHKAGDPAPPPKTKPQP